MSNKDNETSYQISPWNLGFDGVRTDLLSGHYAAPEPNVLGESPPGKFHRDERAESAEER